MEVESESRWFFTRVKLEKLGTVVVQICSQCDTLARILGGRTDAGLRGAVYKGKRIQCFFSLSFFHEKGYF